MILIMNFVLGWSFITHGTFYHQKRRNAIAAFSSNSYQFYVAERSQLTRYDFLFCFDRYGKHVDLCHVLLNKGPETNFYDVNSFGMENGLDTNVFSQIYFYIYICRYMPCVTLQDFGPEQKLRLDFPFTFIFI